MTRQEYNYKILEYLRKEFPENDEIYDDIDYFIQLCPQQRFGQIFCNYVCPDYQGHRPSRYTIHLLYKWFPENLDPFFEESKETYDRLCLKKSI